MKRKEKKEINMQIVILAAGQGSRLFPLTKTIPKSLIRVNKTPLLKFSLDFAASFSPSEMIIVAGYKKELMKKYILKVKKQFSSKIRVLINDKKTSGNIYSLKTALPFIQKSFLLMNTDHIYYNLKIINKIKNSIKRKTFFAVCDFDRTLGEDDMKIKTSKDKKEVMKISKRLKDYNGGYTGITFCSKSFLPKYKHLLKLVLRESKENTAVESVLQLAANKKNFPEVCDISNLGWFEVDTLLDLKKAEKILSGVKDIS